MPKLGKKRASSKDSQAALIEAGIKVFATKGFDGATTRDVVEEAGVNISLIAYHFDGKEGLLDACLDFIAGHLFGPAISGLTPATTAAEFRAGVAGYIERFLSTHVENPYFQRLVFKEIERDSTSFQKVLRNQYAKFFEQLAGYFQAAQQRGIVQGGVDPLNIALSLHGTMAQHIRLNPLRKKILGQSIDDDTFRKQLAEEIRMIFCEGLLKRGK